MEQQPLAINTTEQATLVQAAASAAGLGDGPYRLLRIGTNTVYTNDEDQVVARVAPAHETVDTANDRLRNIALLISAGAPILGALGDARELADGRTLTYWPMADPDNETSWAGMATLAADLHAVPPPPSLEKWTPDHQAPRRERMIAAATQAEIPASPLDFLVARMHEAHASLTDIWNELPNTHRVVVVHGDLYPGNVLFHNGRHLFIDYDFLCSGPPEADLAQIVSNRERVHGDTSGDFVAVYGQPVDNELLRRALALREVEQCLWLTSLWGIRPESREQVLHRIKHWHDRTAPWTDI